MEIKKGDKCVYCGCNLLLALTIDHKIPKSRGGGDEEGNLQITCWLCNQVKSSLNNAEFKKYLTSLQTLSSLKKIRIDFPRNLPIIFKQHHHPDFEYKNGKKNGNKKTK